MQKLAPRKRLLVLAAVMLAAAIGVGIASAVVTSTVLADTNLVREKIVHNEFTPDAAQPTFVSGWHFHPGLAVVQVQEGRLTITQNCQTKKVGPGDTSIEVPFLPVNATASRATKWTTTFLLVNSTPGSPDRVAASEPSCPGGDDDHDGGGH
jgi:hypothetical protein